jgi:hypothetical protein
MCMGGPGAIVYSRRENRVFCKWAAGARAPNTTTGTRRKSDNHIRLGMILVPLGMGVISASKRMRESRKTTKSTVFYTKALEAR